ncbi:MAG: alpha/beta fold hydrolase [Candidatus Margulisbacteria bacterium]|jgi:hypothetical protein|nr:alpha/beta fold hydrolase [Candidatus Margulisiibacteriota bacterium]
MRRLFILLAVLLALAPAELKPVTLRELPEHMRSYKNYIVVMVHGMGGSAAVWDDLKNRLSELVGDPDFATHLYAYSLEEPYAAYYGNAAELGDRRNEHNWLSRARQEFAAAHPGLPAEKIPRKFILLTHSMGALAARSYIYSDTLAASRVKPEEFSAGFYQNDVKKTVFISPTHRGSSMADFIFYYMASDSGYHFGASGLLRRLLETFGQQTDDFSSYAASRAAPPAGQELPVINEIAFREEDLKNYLVEFIKADFAATAEEKAVLRAAAREKADQKLQAELKDRLFEYAKVDAAAGQQAPLFTGGWFKEQVRQASVFTLEKMADALYAGYAELRGQTDNLSDALDYARNFDVQKLWDEQKEKINAQLGEQGYSFLFQIRVDKNWPSGYVPAVKLTYQRWDNISLDWDAALAELWKTLDEYRFSVKLTKDIEYDTSLADLRDKAGMLAELYTPLPRLFQVISELDTAPLFTFPSTRVLLEVNNYCSANAVKELLDFLLVNFFQKKALEEGALPSLLSGDPVTSILNAADLPEVYDPVAFRNVLGRGGVAFDRRRTAQYNQFFYGDLPALQGAAREAQALSGFFSFLTANGYQLKLLTSQEYRGLPSGEARLSALALSYARGVFTKEGDGAVDIDSLQGRNIPVLAAAKNYYKTFDTPALSNYFDRGFAEDTIRAEAACALVELSFSLFGGTTPPYVRGAIRLAPLFNFVAQIVSHQEELLRDFDAHRSMLQSANSLPLLKQALYDAPLLVLHAVCTVSGNETAPLEQEALQEPTVPGQESTTVPLRRTDSLYYLPVAYNVQAPKIRLQAELYDFAPQLAKVEYSFNFAPFTEAETDEWGMVALPDFSVAEGQNIIAFRSANCLGQTNTQYLRIIRSSTPLLASELYPAPQAAVGTGNLTLSALFYNAQFISNNIEVSSVETVRVDGEELGADRYIITRGSNHIYRNFLKLEIPVSLNAGRHTVTLRAKDTYGHQSQTNWFFEVDLSPPEILLAGALAVQPGRDIELNYILSDAQSAALQDLQIVLRKDDRIIWTKDYPLAGAGPQQEIITSLNPLADGEYTVEIACSDLAGNRTFSVGALFIDSTPPEVGLVFDDRLSFSSPPAVFTVTASEEISGQIILCEPKLNVRVPLELEPSAGIYTAAVSAQGLPDGFYIVSVLAVDAAGNSTEKTFGEFLADSTGPQISGLYAEPAVLNRHNAYRAKIHISILEDAGLPEAELLHKSTGRIVYRAALDEQHKTLDLSAAYYLPGAYLIRVTARDALGNRTIRACEIIKDGLAPEISAPEENAPVGGLTLITGKVSDADWTNAQDFESYALYWAEGFRALPADLRELDTQWQSAGLETPYINRGTAAAKNISYRAAPETALLGWWDAAQLPAGAYTLLLVSAEKGLGISAGLVRHVFVEPAGENKLSIHIVPNFPAEVDYALSRNVTFNILNNGATANISAEILDKYGKVVKHSFWPEAPGLVYSGRPLEISDGAYLWQADGWHLLLAAAEDCSFNILLSGVDSVHSAELPYSFGSAVLQLSGELAAGETKEIIFNTQATNLYINAEKNNSSAVWLRLGAGAYTPYAGSYALALTGSAGQLALGWDGRLDAGGYADSGEYTLRLLASGLAGGVCRAAVTFNIATPFTVLNKAQSPADGIFDTFGEINKITFAYTANKDSYLSAAILAGSGITVSVLPEQKIFGSETTAYLSWGGGYPQFTSGQKLVSGDYRAVLCLRSADGERKTLDYPNIRIKNNSSGSLARLDPPGETMLFNGTPVRAVTGSSEYYWSARGEGTYTVPKTFSYELGVSGMQAVTAAPFVPFAGLYHRGFDRVKLKVEVSYRWNIDYHAVDVQYTRQADQIDIFDFQFTPGKQEISQAGSSSYMHKPADRKFDGFGTDCITVTIKDLQGVILYTRKIDNTEYFNDLACNGAFQVNVRAVPWRINNHCYNQSFITIKMLDDIKYSRLTNRYYAWYGYVNKYYPLEFDFTAMRDDLGKLGFVPSSYFLNGLNSVTLNALLKESYPQVLSADTAEQNQSIIEALQKTNVLYESIPALDDSYYNYLDDEYCEFIPMTFGLTHFVTDNILPSANMPALVRVYSDYLVTASIPWPATEEFIQSAENSAKKLIDNLSAARDIDLVDYGALPKIFERQSIDFGGLGSSRLLVPAALGKKGRYQKELSVLAAGLPKNVDRNSLHFTLLKAPDDVRISFDNGLSDAAYASSASVVAHYAAEIAGNIFAWSTEQDFFLKNGVIDSPPLRFNAYGYAPDSGRLPIYEAYFAALNRRADLPAQNITPIDYYTFLERDYYNPRSGYTLNPNLDFERWTVQVYDQTGRPNQDLSVTDVTLSNTDLWQNSFKVKLKLDAVEKRYVRIEGAAAGDYELLYSDGDKWLTICTGNPAEGHLGWWDVTMLNGSYTLALKVHAPDGAYSLAKQDVYVGKLFKSGDSSEANRLVSSPYQRTAVYFHPRSYAEDKFITVSPVRLRELKLQSQPELYTLGPIAEILPHGSSFPDADKRPTVVFRYSAEDLAEMQGRGVDIARLGLYYINEAGALERANSEIIKTDYGLEIWTVLSHFSPYAVLAGEVPEQPTFNVFLSDLQTRRLKIFGRARPDSELEIYLDDDAYLGDRDGENIIDTLAVTTDISAWVFDRRGWNENYADKLSPAEQAKIAEARELLREMYLAALADNQAAEQEFARQYALLITDDQERAELIRAFLVANNRAEIITANSGVALQDDVELKLGISAPALNMYLPERLEIILRKSFPVLSGHPARIFRLNSDARGYFASELPLDAPTASIYVTYVLTGNIQNRPVARLDFAEDPEAPSFVEVALDSFFLNSQSKEGASVRVRLSEEAKLLIYCYNTAGELLDLRHQNVFLTSHTLNLKPADEGAYYYVLEPIDPAGNLGQAYGFALTVDYTPPSPAEITLPAYINPCLADLKDLVKVGENIVTYSIEIADWEIVSGAYAQRGYPYALTAADAAGNTAVFAGIVTVDTTAPVLTNFNFGPQSADGVRIFWPAEDDAVYLLTARALAGGEAATYSVRAAYYYDQQVSRNTFYEYTLQAIDEAGNTGNILRRLVYTADDTLQAYVTADPAELAYKEARVIPRSESLFVVQRLSDADAAEDLQPGAVQLTALYRFLNSAADQSPLEITFAFDPQYLAEQYIRPDSLVVLRRADSWTAAGVELVTLNYQENKIVFRAAGCGDYAVFGGQEYWVYDRGAAQIAFIGLKDNDYVDSAATISARVRDPDTAINTQNIWFVLDNSRYVLPPESFTPDPAGGGRTGRLDFSLQKLLQTPLSSGGHILDLYVLDQLGHTANATLHFTTERSFQIDRILPAPNPFGADGVYFTYQLSGPAESIRLRVYDVNGRLIRELDGCGNQAGYNKTRWDGRDRHGAFVANDVYFYALEVEAEGRKKIYKGKVAALR